jgi:predicted metal-dependent hydrolase
VSRKSQQIAAVIRHLEGRELEAHYLGYFECFNQQLFYEAHDVLEELWLLERKNDDGLFYKSLIQLAGAFVHLQKNRLRPAAALFKLARTNLQSYPATHQHLDLEGVRGMIEKWLRELESGNFNVNPLHPATAPKVNLIERF